ncbi:DUF2637 domain-containing protein [Streptomyces sp. t39]|uniref:DUF2637 domain-containing protein n=1 Tax=Streptomyces sp. t39 TaxID=1828156 RepID=UPI0011CDB499|nr:DUF2637 domain-containing protein [Streptomyces sp. t39]TXS56310.1 DUF2637 domain-containing protein [Streptomyces sp. t39]
MAAMQLTRTHRILIGVVVAGALVIAAIGFAGSYAAVRELAERKGFGDFSLVFPIGIDAGICVLLALDLLLTWMRIPFPLLRQTAWLLTAATIAFNGAAAWPDPLGVGMHAVIPVLFVVAVEAARHAVGRIADITADKHMEGVRLTRWLLSPVPTFKLWRRMKLWELRSYEQVIKLEQDRLIYQARLQARFGRSWRRKAPVESLMPLRLAKYGVPLAETAPAGLAAAGIDPVLLPPAPQPAAVAPAAEAQADARPLRERLSRRELPGSDTTPDGRPADTAPDAATVAAAETAPALPAESAAAPPQEGPGSHESPWFHAQHLPQEAYPHAPEQGYGPARAEAFDPVPVPVPAGPGRTRPLGPGPDGQVFEGPQQRDAGQRPAPGPYAGEVYPQRPYAPGPYAGPQQYTEGVQYAGDQQAPQPHDRQAEPRYSGRGPVGPVTADGPAADLPEGPEAGPDEDFAAEDKEFAEAAYPVFVAYVDEHRDYPKADHLDILLNDRHGVHHPRSTALLKRLLPEFRRRLQADLEAEHIA